MRLPLRTGRASQQVSPACLIGHVKCDTRRRDRLRWGARPPPCCPGGSSGRPLRPPRATRLTRSLSGSKPYPQVLRFLDNPVPPHPDDQRDWRMSRQTATSTSSARSRARIGPETDCYMVRTSRTSTMRGSTTSRSPSLSISVTLSVQPQLEGSSPSKTFRARMSPPASVIFVAISARDPL